MKKNNGNSGLYGRVTKKQMGGAAQPIGMIGRGIVAGRPPPDGGGMRTMDFRDKDKNGIDDRDEIQPGKKSPPMPGGRMPMPPGPMKPPQDPAGSGLVLPPRRDSYGSGAPRIYRLAGIRMVALRQECQAGVD
jgi:hypothetical protein